MCDGMRDDSNDFDYESDHSLAECIQTKETHRVSGKNEGCFGVNAVYLPQKHCLLRAVSQTVGKITPASPLFRGPVDSVTHPCVSIMNRAFFQQ